MRRGRPKIKSENRDFTITKIKLEKEYLRNIEPLDFLLDKDLITQKQHDAGMHLKWLYTLIFGLPTIQAYDPGDLGGRYSSRYKDEVWLKEKHQKYYEAIKSLKKQNIKSIIMNLCIYAELPRLSYNNKSYQLTKIQEGLDILCDCFSKKYIMGPLNFI